MHTASEEGMGSFVGTYTLQLGDTTIQVLLKDEFNNYFGKKNLATADKMNAEYGFWRFDVALKELHIYVHQEFNEALGLILANRREYVFKVQEQQGARSFISPNATLLKVSDRIIKY